MAESRTRLLSLCRTASHVVARATVRSPDLKPELSSNLIKSDQKMEFSGEKKTGNGSVGNRVMVVVDASCEANGALQWALSHSVQSQDTIVLLYVTKQFKGEI